MRELLTADYRATAEFNPAASCGRLSERDDGLICHSFSGITLKVMRRRGGRRTNYGASRRRIHRLVRFLLFCRDAGNLAPQWMLAGWIMVLESLIEPVIHRPSSCLDLLPNSYAVTRPATNQLAAGF